MPQDYTFEKDELDFDRDHLWHPYTSLTNPLPTYPVVSASGVRIKLDSGEELIDGMSSWWTAIHGYNVEEINETINEQIGKMSHVMFGGITHRPAIELGQKLVSLTPHGLNKVFFCDSGSVSVEVAMKMALQFQHAKGHSERSKFMTFRRGYHGDTTGAMSVCDPESGMHHLFSDFVPEHIFLDEPISGFDYNPTDKELTAITTRFEKHSSEIAAFILEPIVQGAGGMRIYSPKYLRHVHSLCKLHSILFIADEIATGFGRTKKMFACEYAEITPDILCLGKALTGGYLSLAATLCVEEVANQICEGEGGVFMHGPTFMANPLACAIASKSLDLLIESDWGKNVSQIEQILNEFLLPLSNLSNVKDVRVLGAIGVVELHKDVDVPVAQKFFVKNGVWIRPFRNLVYIMPPYIIAKDDLKKLTKVISDYCILLNT